MPGAPSCDSAAFTIREEKGAMRFRIQVLALALTFCAAACSTGTQKGTQQSPPAHQQLNVGFTEDQYVVEGPRAGLGAYPLNANIVETLTYLSPTYDVQPLLAERWEFRAPNTWRF